MKNIVSRWTAQVQRDENGECIIIFPPEFCEQTDQREGDLYDFDVVDGCIVMTFLKHAAAIRQYPIAILPGDDQTAYSVYFPDVPGCFSAGDSLSEAIKNAREALELHFEALTEWPDPSRIDDHVNKAEFVGCVWTVARIPEYHG
jgi:predicted RNase H-like HicB family nuclease